MHLALCHYSNKCILCSNGGTDACRGVNGSVGNNAWYVNAVMCHTLSVQQLDSHTRFLLLICSNGPTAGGVGACEGATVGK